MNKYKTFIIVLSNIPDYNGDKRFSSMVHERSFDWWRYLNLNWVLVTPLNVTINDIMSMVDECYANDLTLILEANLLHVATIHKTGLFKNGQEPLDWFNDIFNENYKPSWIK